MELETNRDEKYMREALKEAVAALDRGEVPIGAVVVGGGRIIGRGHNLTETLTDATAHAEMQAITAASAALGGKYLTDCTLYVTVEPCVMCAGAVAWAQVGRLVYGAADPKRGFQRFGPQLLHPRTAVTAGVLSEECGDLVTAFFKKLRS
jgi:tRNA(adenine34) deaminase